MLGTKVMQTNYASEHSTVTWTFIIQPLSCLGLQVENRSNNARGGYNNGNL